MDHRLTEGSVLVTFTVTPQVDRSEDVPLLVEGAESSTETWWLDFGTLGI